MTQAPGKPKIDVVISPNGSGPATPRYCAFCGQEIAHLAQTPERFGEVFCSEEHAEEFAGGVRAARVQAAATADAVAVTKPEAEGPPAPAAKPAGWKMALKMAVCCGLPILALVVLAGGGGAVLGAGAAVLPLLATLACPLAMFFMMRAMMKSGHDDKRRPPRDGDR
jgi:hypothetical protein